MLVDHKHKQLKITSSVGVLPALLILTVALTLVNSDRFPGATMAAYFLYTLLAGILIIAGGMINFAKNGGLQQGIPVSAAVSSLLGISLLAHGMLLGKGVNESQIYLVVSCLFFAALTLVFDRIKNEIGLLYTGIAVIAGIEAMVVLLQYMGKLPSQNHFFRATGTWVNPNVTAGFLAMAMPALLHVLFEAAGPVRKAAIVLILLVVLSLLLLKSRTAIAGALAAALVALDSHWHWWRWIKSRKQPVLIGSLLFSLVLAGLLFAYKAKQASADGRILVWKLSWQMIREKPLTGYGYGMFEQAYNLRQAAYFKSGQGTEQEKNNAGYVGMAYNEFLQNAAEGGIPGLLVFAAVLAYLLLPRRDWKKASPVNESYAGIVGFAVMSFVNFTLQAIPIMCLFVLYAVIIVCSDRARRYLPGRRAAGAIAVIAGIWIVVGQVSGADAQLQNKRAAVLTKKAGYHQADKLLRPLADVLANSGKYWQNRGKLLFAQKKYTEAVAMFSKAAALTSDPALYMELGYCYEHAGQYQDAENAFELAGNIQPARLIPRYALMKLYLREGDTAQALLRAGEIRAMVPKIPSAKADRYKREADRIFSRLADDEASDDNTGL